MTQMVITFVPVTVLAVGATSDIPIELATTAAGMAMVTVIIMHRDITTGKDTTDRAAIVITEAVPIEEVAIADDGGEMF